MFRRIALAALAAALVAGSALAQEYGRASGGVLDLVTKQPSQWSGSLGVSRSQSALFGDVSGLNGSVGGTVVKDRMWFFGSVERSALPQIGPSFAASSKMDANLGASQNLTASGAISRLSLPAMSTTLTPAAVTTAPAWFGSMHYTGIISPNSFFTVNVSQSVAQQH